MPRATRTAPAVTKSPAPRATARRASAKRGTAQPTAAKRAPESGSVSAQPGASMRPAIAPVPSPATQAHAAARDAGVPGPTIAAAPAPKRKKLKLVRDGFTMPEADYALLGALKQRALRSGHDMKKSELLRAGLRVLAAMPDAAYIAALAGVERIKPGRPPAA